ncbi:hypothetical protein DWB77_05508 [Streptomyces hundungensis]|uniref:Uncharacterized protein n=1 Tax=Streptomyces hundungensis TaxID=1077946 RepID=A0A387HQ61_9ACTN|nr:hypothetical protein [Streptomyces hundungensis]AYG83312.1 hypothetical protein DWB77_05508 [Streptomyces hundungensis]
MTEVSNVLRNNGKVAVSLKGFDGETAAEQYALAYKKWRSGDWAATQWEMGQIGLQIQMGNFEWRNITFYSKEGKVVEIPEPNWDMLNG